MSNDTGGAAFPVAWPAPNAPETGMTLRDYFAAKAMQGILPALHEGIRPVELPSLAADAYAIADAMLAERAK